MNIVARNIKKTYNGNVVIDGLSFEIKKAEKVVITGDSGIGKSTVLAIIMGLEKTDEGSIDCKADRIAAVFQDIRLFNDLDPVDNIYIMLNNEDKKRLGLNDKKEAIEHIKKELSELLPYEVFSKKVSQLSGGEKRRVELIRASIIGAKILILDEPFTGLDPDMREKAYKYIMKKNEEKTIIFSDHTAVNFKGCRIIELERKQK